MEELAAEVRRLSGHVRLLTGISALIATTFVAQIVGIYTAASKAGPRLLEMRKRSDALLAENNRLRAELEAARKPASR